MSVNWKNLLVELLVEELPPKALKELGVEFADKIYLSLNASNLTVDPSVVLEATGESNQPYTFYATPRRLAVLVRYVLPNAISKNVAIKLMPASVGLDASGKASIALIKKLQSLGADESSVSTLRKENDVLFLDVLQAGATLKDGLQKALEEALAKLPIPKVMTYQLEDGWTSVNFVRPAHGLVALHGAEVVPVSALGLLASNTTQGHRFEGSSLPIEITSADSYEKQLQDDGAVIASYDKRKAEIVKQLLKIALANNARLDCQPDLFGYDEQETISTTEDDPLINEVTALVEKPNVLMGEFEESFLEVPAECLSLTMKTNQKYFPLFKNESGRKGKLTNKFLIVSNIKPDDPSAVIGGNERVVRPRLADAKFFFDQDRKKTLESRVAGLDKVVYHNKLGSQGERNARVVKIAGEIAKQFGDANLVAKAEHAARLSKADLLTDMVGEFPELQGIMGRYYAQHEGLDNDVAFAIEDHYKPRFAGDELPRNQVGVIVALADKLETLVGMFGIGNTPTGDKDPFALRRHALGVIRIIVERDTEFPDVDNFGRVGSAFSSEHLQGDYIRALREFFLERARSYLRDKGFTTQVIDAVIRTELYWLNRIVKYANAVSSFLAMPEAAALAAANKRIGNILKKADGFVFQHPEPNKFVEDAEKALATALATVKPKADAAFEAGDYTASLQALATLKAPVDDFFDNVMVNVDDPALKANRLGLLATLHQAMNRVADLSKLAS
jgi:glycyl-tRNA synthetase beta chain